MSIESIEAALLDACEKARAMGLDIISGAYIEYIEPEGSPTGARQVCGVCAIEAVREIRGEESYQALFDSSGEQDAVAQGFDAAPRRSYMPIPFYAMGLRLRAKLNPRPARV